MPSSPLKAMRLPEGVGSFGPLDLKPSSDTYGYITTTEAGPMPPPGPARIIWASRPAHPGLDALVAERLARIEADAPPFLEADALMEQDQWIEEQRRLRAPRWYGARPGPMPNWAMDQHDQDYSS